MLRATSQGYTSESFIISIVPNIYVLNTRSLITSLGQNNSRHVAGVLTRDPTITQPQGAYCTLHNAHCILHTAQSTLHTAHYPSTAHYPNTAHHSVHCTLRNAYCTVHFTLHTPQFTLHTALKTLRKCLQLACVGWGDPCLVHVWVG